MRLGKAVSSGQHKVALVIAAGLPVWQSVNAAAVLALSLGPRIAGLLGDDVPDGDGELHLGITTIPVPVLGAPAEQLAALRDRAAAESAVTVVDFNNAAQQSKTYRGYARRLAELPAGDLRYLGVALHGPYAVVDALTDGIPLLT